jgi:hypothetical protein
LRLVKFSGIILLNILHILLACTSSPLMPMIHRFGFLMESLSSCIFLSHLLSILSNSSSVFSLISILSSSPEILSSTCSSLLVWLSSVFFVWFKEFLFPVFLFDSVF